VSREIRHLERAKGYAPARAVAAALAVGRREGFRSLPARGNPYSPAVEEALTALAAIAENTEDAANHLAALRETRGNPRRNPLTASEVVDVLARAAKDRRRAYQAPPASAYHAYGKGRADAYEHTAQLYGPAGVRLNPKPGRGVAYMFRGRGQRNPGPVESLIDGYTGKPALFRTLDLEEIKALRSGQQIWFRALDGRARRAKVNGAVRRWKRDPNRVEVPVKYGLYEYATFDTDTAVHRLLTPVSANPLTRREGARLLHEARDRLASGYRHRDKADFRALRAGEASGLAYAFQEWGPGGAKTYRAWARRSRIAGRLTRRARILAYTGEKPRRLPNPRAGVRVVGTIPGAMGKIFYNRTGKYPGPYVHTFSRGVRAFRLSDGSVLLRGPKPLWVQQD
jgi:hypothetical protein